MFIKKKYFPYLPQGTFLLHCITGTVKWLHNEIVVEQEDKFVKMSDVVSKENLNKFLESNSTDKYYIEYRTYLSNHMSHVAIALYFLHDSKQHFNSFLEHYCKVKLESIDGPASVEQSSNKSANINDLKGQRKSFYQLLQHYKGKFNEEYKGNLKDLINGEFHKLSRGSIGSLLHPLIGLGYGLSVENVQLSLEALAYLHHSNSPLQYDDRKVPNVSSLGKGDLAITEVLEKLRQNDDLFNFMESECNAKNGKFPHYSGK